MTVVLGNSFAADEFLLQAGLGTLGIEIVAALRGREEADKLFLAVLAK